LRARARGEGNGLGLGVGARVREPARLDMVLGQALAMVVHEAEAVLPLLVRVRVGQAERIEAHRLCWVLWAALSALVHLAE